MAVAAHPDGDAHVVAGGELVARAAVRSCGTPSGRVEHGKVDQDRDTARSQGGRKEDDRSGSAPNKRKRRGKKRMWLNVAVPIWSFGFGFGFGFVLGSIVRMRARTHSGARGCKHAPDGRPADEARVHTAVGHGRVGLQVVGDGVGEVEDAGLRTGARYGGEAGDRELAVGVTVEVEAAEGVGAGAVAELDRPQAVYKHRVVRVRLRVPLDGQGALATCVHSCKGNAKQTCALR